MNTTLILLSSGFVIFFIYLYYNYNKRQYTPIETENDKIIHLNVTNFQKEINKGIVLVDFWAEWCMPCKTQDPILNDIAGKINEEARIGKLNVDDCQILATKFDIRTIPTLILFKDGKEIDRFTGVMQKEFLWEQLNQNN
ncbi:MAG: thioredoxin [Bacteroidetes bacterium]|nr:thioredoxin [Bacteroidota bacterium]